MSLIYTPASVHLTDDGISETDDIVKLEYPEFKIPEENITSVTVKVSFRHAELQFPTASMYAQRDHPNYTELRIWLSSRGFIDKVDNYVNGDRVTKKFKLNGVKFEVGDKFLSPSAMSSHLERERKKEPTSDV